MPDNDKDKIKETFSGALRDYEAEADERVWNRIEAELHPKKRRMVFYWAAAAVLLMAVLIPFYFIRRLGDEKKLVDKKDEVIQEKQEMVSEKKQPLITPKSPEGDLSNTAKGENTKSIALTSPLSGGRGVNGKEKPASEKEGIIHASDDAMLASEHSKDAVANSPALDDINSNAAQLFVGPVLTKASGFTTDTNTAATRSLPEPSAMNILIPELHNPAEEQHTLSNIVFTEATPVLIPPPGYNGWFASANLLSSSGLSAGGGDPFTFTIPNSGDKIPVYSTDTIGSTINRTTTWNQEVQQTSIGYIPVSLATTNYDTIYQIVQTTDTIRTPDKEGSATPGDIKYGLPVMTGISFSYRLNEHWAVGTGLSYSIFTAGQEISYSDNTYEKINLKLQYAGIPVHVAYYFISKRNLVTYISAGSSFEWNISDRSTLVTTRKKQGEETTEAKANKPKGSQLYLNIGGGAEYLITRKIAFYLQPSLTMFAIKPDSKYHPANEKKYFPSVQTGIRYHF